MTIAEAIAELRCFQNNLDPEGRQSHADIYEAIDVLLNHRSQLLEQLRTPLESFTQRHNQLLLLIRVLDAARTALASCRTGMKSLVGDGVYSPRFNSDAEQFAAAWRDLRKAVDNVIDHT